MKTPRRLPKLSDKQIQSFWSKVDRKGHVDCWNWKGSTTGRIYATARYGTWKVAHQNMRPHRVAYELLREPIGEMTIDHLCQNTLCCNPYHCEVVSLEENIRRRVRSTAPHNPARKAAQ